MMPIEFDETQLDGEYGFLDNSYPSPIEINGNIYPTLEHFY